MNEKLLKKVFNTDPREKRRKTPGDIKREWRDRRLIGLVFKWAIVLGALTFIYWYFFERTGPLVMARRLPLKARWSLGVTIFSVFGWLGYAFFGYRCPVCTRYVGLDFGMGAWLLGFEEPKKVCRACQANLD